MKSLLSFAILFFLALSSYAQDTCITTLPYGNNAKAGVHAKVNGITMYYETYGPVKAPPLLLIHGNGGSIYYMRCQIEHFKQNYRVIAVDSRYHGKTEDGDKPLTYELMADDYAALIKHLKLDSVSVIGQSDGAIIVLLLAINHSGSIKKGVAMAPNLRPDSTALYGYIVKAGKNRLDSLNRLVRSGRKEPALLREVAQYELMDKEPNIPTSNLSRANVPILLMAADGDAIVMEHIVEIYRALPKANLLIMPSATHTMLRGEYELFNQMCERFLSKPFSRPSTAF